SSAPVVHRWASPSSWRRGIALSISSRRASTWTASRNTTATSPPTNATERRMKNNGHRNGNNGGVRVDCISETRHVRVPEWVLDLESFRRWSDADDFPDSDRVEWLRGGVRIDMSREQL